MTSRYDADPNRQEGKRDIVEIIKNINDRLASQETSLQIGNTTIEKGNLTVKSGDIVVVDSNGNVIIRIFGEPNPEFRFFLKGEGIDTRRAVMYSFDGGPIFGQVFVQNVETTSAVSDGGKVYLSNNIAVFSHHPQFGQELYLWLNVDSEVSEAIAMRGGFRGNFQYTDRQALYPGIEVASAGFSTWTHSYASSFVSTPTPIITVNYAGATLQYNLDSYGQASFTTRFSTTTNTKTINFWVFRSL